MSDIKTYTVTEPYLKLDCALGEAPFYDESLNTLRFVDIIKQKLHVIDLGKGVSSHTVKDLEISVGVTADIHDDEEHFIFGGKAGYGKMNRRTAEYQYIKRYWDGDANQADKERCYRGNDGAVDAKGRFWVGTMRDPLINAPTNDGVVFRLDPDNTLHRMIEGVTIPNGISWTQDNKTMYFADSPTKNVFRYDYDLETGAISHRRVLFHVDDENGVPDGHALDEEGCVWQAIHGAGKVIRISPQGQVLAEVRLPTRCVTCPGFVREDLYVTSAEDEDPGRFPASLPYQGSIFKVHVGVRGQRKHRFRQVAA